MGDQKEREVRMTARRKSRPRFDRHEYRKMRRFLAGMWLEMYQRYQGGRSASDAVRVPFPEQEERRSRRRGEDEL